jgi:hypothetical protein
LIPIESNPFSKILAIVITAGVIFPFAMSAMTVLSNHIEKTQWKWPLIGKLIEKLQKSPYAVDLTSWGFVYLLAALIILFVLNLAPFFFSPTSPVLKTCEKDVKYFGMTSKDSCVRITPGSLYEECVKKAMPNVSGCSKFIVD